MTNTTRTNLTRGRISSHCGVCGLRKVVPNSGLNRATLAAWETRHQHPEESK